MQILFLGNFEAPYSSENYHKKTLEKMGHTVIPIQEGRATVDHILSYKPDLFVWIHTHDWPLIQMNYVLDVFAHRGVITLTYHLDLWIGLNRQKEMNESYFNVQHFFTVDKMMADYLNRHTETYGHYVRAGVFEDDCYYEKSLMLHEVIFVGAYNYHPEYSYRKKLIDWLRKNISSFEHINNGTRGAALNKLYAGTKIVVGDSCCINLTYPYYWSDRVYETTGRGGFIIHPYIKGMEEDFEDKKHLVYYKYDDFNELHEKIQYYLNHPEEREAIRIAGQQHTKNNHTYTHRWKEILNQI